MHEDIDLSLHLADHELRIQYWPQMVSGMSARRLEDSPRDYRYYVTRFDRTYKAHNVKKMALKAPMVVFFSVYFPAKLLRRDPHGQHGPACPPRRPVALRRCRRRRSVRPQLRQRGRARAVRSVSHAVPATTTASPTRIIASPA